MSGKVEYTAVPLEETTQEQELPAYSKELPANHASASNICSHKCQERRKVWRKTLILVVALFLGGRLILAGLSLCMLKGFNKSDSYDISIDEIIDDPETVYNEDILSSKFPNEPACAPVIRWNGPSELLIDPRDISGLLFSVKGMSARGSVIIRQDPYLTDLINITNNIYLSEDDLQGEIDIRIDIVDEDYTIVIESPTFDGPRPTQKCVLVDTIITLPKHINFFRSLLVDVPNGWISAESLENVKFAYVNLKTRNGHIRSEHLDAAISEISTVNGHVRGVYSVDESLDVRTVNGAIRIDAVAAKLSEDISITARSINGHVDLNVQDLTDVQRIDLKVGSVNGGVIANVPDVYTGKFTLNTLIGYVYIEGNDITYIKNTRNSKIGYKDKSDDKVYRKTKCSHAFGDGDDDDDDSKSSHLSLEAVTGAVELYFV